MSPPVKATQGNGIHRRAHAAPLAPILSDALGAEQGANVMNIMPAVPDLLASALVEHRAGRLHLAEQLYRQILALEPNHADAVHLLGVVAHQTGRHEQAVDLIRRAVELTPGCSGFHNNLGEAYRALHRIPEAVAAFRRALELQPDYAEAHNNLGNALHAENQGNEAIACYRRALGLKPDYAKAHNNLGNVLQEFGSWGEAIASHRRAVQIKPDFADAHCKLGNALARHGRRDEAIACYRRALELKPDYADAYHHLGGVLKFRGKLDETIACYRRALALKPDDMEIVTSLAHQLQQMCCWEDVPALERRLIASVDNPTIKNEGKTPPFSFLTLSTPTTAEQQLHCARAWVEQNLKPPGPVEPVQGRRRQRASNSRITVGYLSGDFHTHATALLVAELFEKHDRARFAVHGYSYGPDDRSPMRRRLVAAFDRFVDLQNATYAEAARCIAADEVDILIDLKGYAANCRPQILAASSCPHSGQLPRLSRDDGRCVGGLHRGGRLYRPCRSAAVLQRTPGVPARVLSGERQPPGGFSATPSRAECQLPPDGFVFCCFNNNYKITSDVFDVWMRLLKAVPGSVLWLLEATAFAASNLRAGGRGPRRGRPEADIRAAYVSGRASHPLSVGGPVPRHVPSQRPHDGQRQPLAGLPARDAQWRDVRVAHGGEPPAPPLPCLN